MSEDKITVEDAIAEKFFLEGSISNLIEGFVEKTGLEVESIKLGKIDCTTARDAPFSEFLYTAKIEVKL